MHRFSAIASAVLSVMLLLGLVAVTSASPYTDVVLGDNPVSYWRLGETSGTVAVDETGGSNGTYRNGVAIGQPGALVGDGDAAAEFDGIDDDVRVTTFASGLYPNLSVELWTKPDTAAGSWRAMFNEQSSDTLWINGTGNSNLRVYLGDTNNKGYHSSNATLTANVWHHVAITYDDDVDELKLYVNGQLDKTVTTSGIPNFDSSLSFGRNESTSAQFKGSLDEIAVYGETLSAGQIADHYATGITGVAMPVADVVTFHMDEGTGTTIHDSSANQVTGTLVNGTGWGTGKYGDALSFDGDDDYARSTQFPAGQYAELTLEMWVNPVVDPSGQTLFNEQSGDTLWMNMLGSNRLAIYLGDTTNRGYHNSIASIPDGQWTHLALTYSDDADELKLYFNGLLDNTISTSGLLNFDSSINLGMREDLAGSGYFKGLMDELAIYSRALSATEILARANGGPPVATPEPGSIVLFALGLLGLLVRRRRRVGRC